MKGNSVMKIIKSFAGVLAILFSIQPLASWAANAGEKNGAKEQIKILLAKSDSKGGSEGGPSCHGGG
jgi:hypothetical protein